jgi:hypothetical protein
LYLALLKKNTSKPKRQQQQQKNMTISLLMQNIRKHKIIAQENFSYSLFEGMAEIERYCKLDTIGVCFYHEQDVDYASRMEDLYIAYSAVADASTGEVNDRKSKDIGRIIVKEAKALGLTVEWNENAEERIKLFGIDATLLKGYERNDNHFYE